MSQQIPYSMKQCGTCAYWAGDREADRLGQRVYVDNRMQKGKCMCRGSGWMNSEKQACSTCTSYQRWSVLK